jgi:hypothetical protein
MDGIVLQATAERMILRRDEITSIEGVSASPPLTVMEVG